MFLSSILFLIALLLLHLSDFRNQVIFRGNHLERDCYCGKYVDGERKWHPNRKCHYIPWMDTTNGKVYLILKCWGHS